MATRRQFLGLCSMLGIAGAARVGLSGTNVEGTGLSSEQAFSSLYHSLSAAQRSAICKSWDDPSRQLVNTGACVMTEPVDHVLDLTQRQLVTGMFRDMCSEPGFERQQYPAGFESGMLGAAEIVIYGKPGDAQYQVSLNGAHLMVRGGKVASGEDVFGGPIAYGSQLGNGFARIPGNPFRYQSELANDLLLTLDDRQFERGVLAKSAFEMDVSFRPRGHYQGVSADTFNEQQLESLSALLKSVLENYDAKTEQLAWSTIESNGGLSELSVSWFADRAYARSDESRKFHPVWRVEGPGLVWHFQGWPHVHAYLNLAGNGGIRGIGDTIGELERSVAPAETRTWLEQAFAGIADTQYGYHMDTLAGQFFKGPVTAGDLYSFLPFRNRLVVATIKPEAMAADLRMRLQTAGYQASNKPVRVATLDYYTRRKDVFGSPEKVEQLTHIPPRKELVEYTRQSGLPA